MRAGFSVILCELRREKGINQRQAAAHLQISQALLSHYEKGIREPGLEFVDKVCDYYGVTADYLLGRSPVREKLLYRTQEETRLNSSLYTNERFKRDINAFAALLGIAASVGGEELVEELLKHVGADFYKMYGYFSKELDTLPSAKKEFALLSGAQQNHAELQITRKLEALREKNAGAHMESLAGEYPERFKTLFDFVSETEKRIEERI